jgi:nucleoside-diphosphate-sugar epimerase
MKVLVTGGLGFAGSNLTRRLLKGGHQVVVLDTQHGLYHDELQKMGAEIHLGSVTDADLVDRVTRGCEVVHHLAAMFRKVNQPKSVYWDVNVEGTRLLLSSSLDHGVRSFVYCSTQGVHGDIKQEPGDENSPISPEDYYQYTKYEGERVIPEFLGKGMKIVTLRPTAIYGPGDPDRYSILFKRVKNGRFLMFGSGKVHYHPVHVANLSEAFELAAEGDQGDGEAYIIGDDKYYALNELVTAIARSLGKDLIITHLPFWPIWTAAVLCEGVYKPFPADPPLFRRRVDWFRQNRAFSIDKAKRDLGYQPKVGLEEGLAETASWYLEHGII